jgi:hypothetical protein
MRIDVTAKDIQNGIPANPHDCPIALAVKRKIQNPDLRITVTKNCIHAEGFLWGNTQEVQDFVRDFDSRNPVKPFSFELPVLVEKTLLVVQEEKLEEVLV